MRVFNYTDFRKNMKSIFDKTAEDRDVVIISRSAEKDMVLISLAEYNSWMETLHLLKTDANAERLSKAIHNIASGKYEQHSLIDD